MTNAQTEARAIARCVRGCATDDQYVELIEKIATAFAAKDAARDEAVFLKDCAEAALVKRESELVAKNAELAAVKSKCQALDDECQQSMLDIARERDRAERAEAQLGEARKALELAERMMTKDSLCEAERLEEGLRLVRRARESQGGE